MHCTATYNALCCRFSCIAQLDCIVLHYVDCTTSTGLHCVLLAAGKPSGCSTELPHLLFLCSGAGWQNTFSCTVCFQHNLALFLCSFSLCFTFQIFLVFWPRQDGNTLSCSGFLCSIQHNLSLFLLLTNSTAVAIPLTHTLNHNSLVQCYVFS